MAVIELGRRLYLHKMGNGYAPRVLITAHGGIYRNGKEFDLPGGVTCKFYSVHGTVLQDPGVTKVLEGDGVKVVEELTGGKCYNYELSKYQGYHGGKPGKPAETYESIHRSQGNFSRMEGDFKKMGDPVVQKATYEGSDSLTKVEQAVWRRLMRRMEEYGQLYKDDCDVITVRNRTLSIGEVTLEYVIKKVREANPKYEIFECSFCRSFMD